jgi:hypothetical protein
MNNSAYDFDGNDDQIFVNHSNSVSPNQYVTVNVWIYPRAYEDNKHCVSKGSHINLTYRSYGIQGPENNQKARFFVSNGTSELGVSTINNLPLNQWSLITGVYDGSSIKIFLNGILDNQVNFTGFINQTTEPLIFGSHKFYASSDYWFNGKIDDIGIWNRALTQQEITALYQSQNCNLNVSLSQNNVSTNGGSNGSATVTVSGGTTPYAYTWAPSGGNGATATSLVAGTYTCTITDAANCTTTQTVNITQPAPPSACLPNYVPTNGLVAWYPFCGNANDESGNGNNGTVNGATLTADRNGNTGKAYLFSSGQNIQLPNSIVWNNLNGLSFTGWVYFNNIITNTSTANTILDFSDGNCDNCWGYRYSIGQSNNNIGFGREGNLGGSGFSINTPVQPYASNWIFVAAIIDNGVAKLFINGSLVSSTNSNTNPLNISLGSSNSKMIGVRTVTNGQNLLNGKVDDIGIWNRALTQQEITALYNSTNCNVSATISQTNVICNGGSTGSASVTATGGTAPYTYNWAPSGGTFATASNLTAGSYTCTITDANQCTITKTVTITQPSAVTATTSQTNVSCNGGATGSASVTASGGTAPYTYSWAPSGGTLATASNLAAGSYTCTIRDANQCTITKTVTITQPSAVTATTTQTNVSCNGGTNGSATVSATGGSAPYTYSWAPSGGTLATASNLAAGTYTCTIRDANQCTITKTVTITQPSAVTATTTQTNVNCNGGTNGSATVSATGGTAPYTYSWTPSGGILATASNLAAGSYTCTIRDANQCAITKTVTITQPIAVTATTTQTNVSCNGGSTGSASVTASGGTAPYTYSWAPSGGNLATASNLATGTYTCTITDANQCAITKTVTITQPSAVTATTSQTNVSCNGGTNGSATVSATGGSAPYTYSWAPSGGTLATASSLATGSYTCTIRDANQCTITKTVTITQPIPLTISISPLINYIQTGNNTSFNAMSQDPSATISWQTNHQGLQWQSIQNNSFYSGATTNTLTVNSVQLNNHLQTFRAIASNGNCADTTVTATLHVSDTCIVTVNDTNFVTVTDTNYVTVYDTVTTYISVTDTLFIDINTVGLNNNAIVNTIKVFPNPSNSILNLDYGNYATLNNYRVKITNALSQIIYDQAITQQIETIDLSTFGGAGIYYLSIINPQGNVVEVRKIVLQ